MMRLLTDDAIEKIQEHEVTVRGRTYRTIFRFTDIVADDTHAYEAGFAHEGEELTGTVYLPSLTEEGLFRKNRTLWYPVALLVPPPHFRRGRTFHLNGLLNDSTFASALSDFFPEIMTMKPGLRTPLYRSLWTKEAEDANDLFRWIVLDPASAVMELFNLKIVHDIARSLRGGFRGITATVHSLHALIRAFSRHLGNDEDGTAECESLTTEDGEMLGRRNVESRRNIVLIHPFIREVEIAGVGPIDFTGCSQSHPFTTAQIKDGIEVRDHRMIHGDSFPYARSRRDTVGIMNDDPRRMIVARSTSRAMELECPDAPYAETEFASRMMDSLSLPGVRMTHPLTYEDGIVVSRTFAEKAGAYKMYTDRFTVPADATVFPLKEACVSDDPRAIAREACTRKTKGIHTVNRGEAIAVVIIDRDTEPVEVKSQVRHRAALFKIERFVPATDIAEPSITHQYTSITLLPLSVGDKVSDAHGNKATVSAILPDEDMPLWEGRRCHYIATPYVMKRLAVGAEIEDKLALIGQALRQRGDDRVAVLASSEVISLTEVNEELARHGLDYTGEVRFQGTICQNVPISYRKMHRLDNNALETVTARTGIAFKDGMRESRNIRLGLEVLTFLTRGACHLTAWLIDVSSLRDYTSKHVLPILHAVRDHLPERAESFAIKRRLPTDLLGKPVSRSAVRMIDLAGTCCDERIATKYGIIRLGRKTVIVPPHIPFNDTGMGYVTTGTIAVAANRIIAETLSRQAVGAAHTDVAGKIERYKSALASLLAGKGGRIQEAVTPVFPTTIRAVASPYPGDDPFEIALPKREYQRLLKASLPFRRTYVQGRNLCILKRDPVHRGQNVFGVRFTVWEHATIGVNPVIIRSLDADYDGDIVVAMFPTEEKAYADIPLLIPRLDDIFSPSKQLYDATPGNALALLKSRIGWTSTFEHPHPSDRLVNEALLARLIEGMEVKELSEECVRAVRDFDTIKTGTALTGALALRFIYSRDSDDAELIHAACELYHTLAQDTLDAKSGKAASSLRIVEAFNEGRESVIESMLHDMGFTHERCIDALKTFCLEVKAAGSMNAHLRRNFPVLAAIQRNAGAQECRALADLVIGGGMTEGGIWERLFAYAMGSKQLSSIARCMSGTQ